MYGAPLVPVRQFFYLVATR